MFVPVQLRVSTTNQQADIMVSMLQLCCKHVTKCWWFIHTRVPVHASGFLPCWYVWFNQKKRY